MTHTPIPLRIRCECDNLGYKGIVLTTPDGCCIANMVIQLDGAELANAKFIANACNAHEDLVTALQGLLYEPMSERAADAARKILTAVEKGA